MWQAASSRTSTVIHGRYGPVPWKISQRPWSILEIRCCHGPPYCWWADWMGPTLSAGQTVTASQPAVLAAAASAKARWAMTLPIE